MKIAMVLYDVCVLGGGSGGIAFARRAAAAGARVALVERSRRLGGTCVNVGCVPKKVMWNAANVAETVRDSSHFGVGTSGALVLDYARLKELRDRYVERLNGIYGNNLKGDESIDLFAGAGRVESSAPELHSVSVTPVEDAALMPHRVNKADGAASARTTIQAKKVVLACGGYPTPLGVPGAELCNDSDGFFEAKDWPRSVAVVGAGYIAVELAGIYAALGVRTTLCVRGATALRRFDSLIASEITPMLERQGVRVVTGAVPAKVERLREVPPRDRTSIDVSGHGAGLHAGEASPEEAALRLTFEDGRTVEAERIIAAVGRTPRTNLCEGVKTTASGHIVADAQQETNLPGVYALGDGCGEVELTPMAIAAGRILADRLFRGQPGRACYSHVPTVIFTHPPIATVGLTEAEARARGPTNVYTNDSVNLYYGQWPVPPAEKPKTRVKMICQGPNDTVVGLHIIGMGADEMLQGFAVAIRMGATKKDFDQTLAIHPTASEEVVTIKPWEGHHQ